MTDHSDLQPLLADLLAVCRVHALGSSIGVAPKYERAFDEPYVPWMASNAPTVLVLAESQNLSTTPKNARYVKRIQGLGDGRPLRLLHGDGEGGIGIEPWDNGTLKLAGRVILDEGSTDTLAVSNAVPWSWRVRSTGANARPFSSKVKKAAGAFWKDIFDQWPSLRHVVAAGSVARDVMKEAEWPKARTSLLVLPSPRWDGAAGMFAVDHLLHAFPKARAVMASDLAEDAIALAGADEKARERVRRRLTFYACHAASRAAEGSGT